MPRISTQQPSTSRPVLIAVKNLQVSFTTIAEAPDYSVPDPTVRWPNERDPADADRRIQPGQALFVTPLFVHNRDTEADHYVLFQIVTQAGDVVEQGRIDIPALETYSHPIAGITLTKTDLSAANGDRLQVRASTNNMLDITGTLNIGAADQDQPG